MLKCCECGKVFDASDAKYVQELVGEFWGAPAYETWMHCPHCGSDEIDDYFGSEEEDE